MSLESNFELNPQPELQTLVDTYTKMAPEDVLEIAKKQEANPRVLFMAAQTGMETSDWEIRAKWQGVLLAVIGPSFDY